MMILSMALWLGLGVAVQTETPQAPQKLERRSADGEQCLVCRQSIREGDIIRLRYRGRTFFVAEKMADEFLRDPERYFGALEARTALFDEKSLSSRGSSFWLFLATYLTLGLVCGAVCGYWAVSKGLPAIGWFAAGLLGNLIAVAALAFAGRSDLEGLPQGVPGGLRKVPTTHAPTRCPDCGVDNHPSALRCIGCRTALNPTVAAETAVLP